MNAHYIFYSDRSVNHFSGKVANTGFAVVLDSNSRSCLISNVAEFRRKSSIYHFSSGQSAERLCSRVLSSLSDEHLGPDWPSIQLRSWKCVVL